MDAKKQNTKRPTFIKKKVNTLKKKEKTRNLVIVFPVEFITNKI
jgi:hypothetical protein